MKVQVRACALLALALAATRVLAEPSAAGGGFNFNVAPANGAAVKANADLKAGAPDLQSDLLVSLEADPTTLGSDPLKPALAPTGVHEVFGLKTGWSGSGGLQADVSLSDQLDQSYRANALGLVDTHQIGVEDRGAAFGLTARPTSAFELSLTGAANDRSVLDTASVGGALAGPHSRFETAGERARLGAKWRLTPWFSLDAGGTIGSAAAAWRGAAAAGPTTGDSLSYGYVDPAVTGSLTTPGSGAVNLTFEHAISPIDPGAFAAFAGVDARAPGARFSPNREWRYRLELQQRLAGQIELSAAVTRARIETATELGPVGADLQAPVSTPGGERREFDLSLSAPLVLPGLSGLTLKGAGAWRESQVRDPFTGEYRRASGESPQTATLDLTQVLGQARWGLQGRFGGDQSVYQMSQVTSVSVADSLGGFVEYDPGAFALRLQVDGLYGGERTATDVYYAAPRPTGYVERIDRRTEDGQAVRLVLSKAL